MKNLIIFIIYNCYKFIQKKRKSKKSDFNLICDLEDLNTRHEELKNYYESKNLENKN